MDEFAFEPDIRHKIKQAIVDVFLHEGHERDMAADAGEMFVRLIETGLTRIDNAEQLGDRSKHYQS